MNLQQLIKQFHQHHYISFKVDECFDWIEAIENENWQQLIKKYQHFLNQQNPFTQVLRALKPYTKSEWMLSVRDANDSFQEDGIWHDDGSRVLAVSLSLTTCLVEGGILALRNKKTKQTINLQTPDYAHALIFKTGVDGFEHKIHQVTKGKRVVMVTWLS